MKGSFIIKGNVCQTISPQKLDLHENAYVVCETAFRGTSMDLELMDWLNPYTFPEEEKYENLKYAEKAYSLFVDVLKKWRNDKGMYFCYSTSRCNGTFDEAYGRKRAY